MPMTIAQYFQNIRDSYPTLGKDIITTLVKTKAVDVKSAYSLHEFREHFKNNVGYTFPIKNSPALAFNFLLTFAHVGCYVNSRGTIMIFHKILNEHFNQKGMDLDPNGFLKYV